MEPYERTVNCLYCHDEFTFIQDSAKPRMYCSKDCRAMSRKTGDKRCQMCGEHFVYEMRSGRGTTCSPECRTALDRPRCILCHAPRPTGNALDVYCSEKCQQKATPKNCESCGEQTVPLPGSLRGYPRFCDEDCRTAWLMENRPKASKYFHNPRLAKWIDEANSNQYPPISGPLERGIYPFYVPMPPNLKRMSRRLANSINFWNDEGIPWLIDEIGKEQFIIYYVSHGRLPIDMNYRIDLNNSASLWEITPWLYPVLKDYDIGLMRKGTDKHTNELKKREHRIRYLQAQAEAFNDMVRSGVRLGSKQAEVKRTIKKGKALVERLIKDVQEYAVLGSQLTTCSGLIYDLDRETMPETRYYEYADEDMPDYPVTLAHSEITIKWMQFRDECERDTEETVGKDQFRMLYTALPDTIDYYVGRWYGAKVDVMGNISDLAFERHFEQQQEPDDDFEDWV